MIKIPLNVLLAVNSKHSAQKSSRVVSREKSFTGLKRNMYLHEMYAPPQFI